MGTPMQVDDTLGTSFGERFIEDYLGQKMSSDPITAIVELIANSWDAGAKKVVIAEVKQDTHSSFFYILHQCQ